MRNSTTKLKEVRYQDVYHKTLCYCLGISDDTRRNVYRIYDFKQMRNNRVFAKAADQWKYESDQNGILICIAMEHQVFFLIAKMQKNRWTSAGSTRWRKYSAVLMHHISGKGNSDSVSEYATYNHKLYALLGGTD